MGDPCGVIWMHGLGDTEQGWPAELAAQQAYWFPVIAVVDQWLHIDTIGVCNIKLNDFIQKICAVKF